MDFLYLINIDIAVHNGVNRQRRHAPHAEFVHDVFAVRDDGRQTDVQLLCNFLVDQPLYDQRQYFDLPVAQNLVLQHLRQLWKIPSA